MWLWKGAILLWIILSFSRFVNEHAALYCTLKYQYLIQPSIVKDLCEFPFNIRLLVIDLMETKTFRPINCMIRLTLETAHVCNRSVYTVNGLCLFVVNQYVQHYVVCFCVNRCCIRDVKLVTICLEFASLYNFAHRADVLYISCVPTLAALIIPTSANFRRNFSSNCVKAVHY